MELLEHLEILDLYRQENCLGEQLRGKMTSSLCRAMNKNLCPKLRHLSLASNSLNDAQLSELMRAMGNGGCKNLRSLSFRYSFTDGALKEFVRSFQVGVGFPSLKYLDLGGTRVESEGLKLLAGAMKDNGVLKSLEGLDLFNLYRTWHFNQGLMEMAKAWKEGASPQLR